MLFNWLGNQNDFLWKGEDLSAELTADLNSRLKMLLWLVNALRKPFQIFRKSVEEFMAKSNCSEGTSLRIKTNYRSTLNLKSWTIDPSNNKQGISNSENELLCKLFSTLKTERIILAFFNNFWPNLYLNWYIGSWCGRWCWEFQINDRWFDASHNGKRAPNVL